MTVAVGQRRRTVRRRSAGNSRARLLWVLGVVLAGFLLLVTRLADLQVINPDRYRAVGESQRTVSQRIAAERGTIYDRNGVELVMSTPSQSVFVDPALIDDAYAEAAMVAPILGLDIRQVEDKMRGAGRFAYLARKVTDEQAQRIAALGLRGVALVEESQRHLPSGDMARSILGSVDVDNAGISGLEQAYGDALTGTPGELVFERTPEGRTIPIGEHQLVPAVKGDDLVLTLDRSLQYETERILGDQLVATESRGGIAIVTKPATGEILAMANMVRDETNNSVVPGTNNAALTTVYEPGSVMKMATVSAALEKGVVTPDTVIQVPSKLRVGDADFQDAEEHGPMAWSVTEVLAHSSNIGTIKVAQQVGKDRLYETLRGFGFGQETALGFPNEQAGVVPDPADPTQWWSTSMGTVPIGQGVSVSPLQMLLAYNVIANGGTYVEPRLVRSTIDAEGTEHPVPIDDGRRVLSHETADKVNLMLRDVVVEGTGKNAAVSGYTPAGKTGTSRKAQPGGGYVDAVGVTQYQSTFVGFVPAEQPALSIIVIIDEPGSGQYTGGMVAAPAWSRIASFSLHHFGVPPPLTDGPAGGSPAAGESVGSGKVRGLPAEQAPPPPPSDTPVTTTSTTTPTTTSKKPTAPSR
jgi:cell division protein FtsI (penicillin-binding protein 3)